MALSNEFFFYRASEHFSPSFLSNIEHDCGDNWFLRVSNLRRIYLSIVDYYSEVLDRQIPEKIQPDVEAISRDYDLVHLGYLLQLILGCAINCLNKEKHIEVMTTLSFEVKQGLKIAIDELENFDECSIVNDESSFQVDSSSNAKTFSENEFCKLQQELSEAKMSKDDALKKYSELETKINKIKEEKRLLKVENEKLVEKLSFFNSNKNISINDSNITFDSIEHENLFQRLNNQINSLQVELTRMEEQKEDYRINFQVKEKEYLKLMLQVEQLQAKLNQFKHDRDELDRLKYLNEEVIKFKNINEVQKKKLEEFHELKKQIKVLEDRNAVLIKQTYELEEDKKSLAVYKSQIDMIKKQRDDLRSKVNEESFRADKSEDELKRIYKKYNDVTQDKEKLQIELESLKLEISNYHKGDTLHAPSIDLDLSSSLAAGNVNATNAINSGLSMYKSNFGNNSQLNEKIIRLELENSKLKKELKDSNDEKIKLLESQLEDEKCRIEKLELENRTNNQKIIELEGHLKDKKVHKNELDKNPDDTKSLQLENSNLKSLVEKLTEELAAKEERFKMHLNKAKQTFGLLQTHVNNPKTSNSLPDTSKVQAEDTCYWRNLANQKEIEIEKIKKDFDKSSAFRDMEERLMTISFHNMVFYSNLT